MEPDASSIGQRLDEAIAHHRAGRFAEAARAYEAVLAHEPAHFDALQLLGLVSLRSGKLERAVDLLTRAVALQPDAFPVVCNLASAQAGLDRADAAETLFVRAIALAPDYGPAREGYGFLLHGRGRYAAAAEQFEQLVRLTPGSAAALHYLATAMGQLGRFAEAFDCFERAVAIEPGHLEAHLNTVLILEKMGRPLEAVERARSLLARFPDHAGLHYQAGRLFYAQGLHDESLRALDRAMVLEPNFVEARWALAMAALPQAYGPNEDPAQARAQFADAIAALSDWFDDARAPLGHRALGEVQPFYLAFQETDNVALLSGYGDLCERLMKASGAAAADPVARRARGGPVRVAMVSGHFFDQSVWTALARGWCEHLDPERVELHLFHTGSTSDAETTVARSHAAGFHTGLGDVFRWTAALRDLEPDVILYLEIGMDPMCAKLASMRLAPTQMVAWGHPETSGLPTLDYFISGAAFEPADGAAHYREQLIALPGLGCYYEALMPPFTEPPLQALGLDRDVPRLICAGTPYKYLPQHDHLLVEIARRLGECQFLFFIDKAPLLSQKIEQRLHAAFRGAGLDGRGFVRFLPRQSRPAFFALMQSSDAYLDTLGFSGFNTAMQAVECELPVVTCEGQFMRGRLAGGILRTMGMHELVAPDARSYVDVAVRLCRDASYRLDAARRMAAQSGVLFRDLAPVRALEALFRQARDSR